jgi:toxin FitB
VSVAYTWADLRHQLRGAGKPMPVEDSYIAATALRHNLIIVTGNERDFQRPGIKLFNPFRELTD